MASLCFRLRGLPHHQNRRVVKCMYIKVSECVVSSCNAQEASNMVQEAPPATMDKSGLQVAARKLARGTQAPSTVLVWVDGVRSGHVVLCKSISAGAVRLRTHATETSKVDCLETLDHRWQQDHRIGANPETRAEDVAERAVQAFGEVPDTNDSLSKEAKCTRKTKEKLLGARKAFGPSTRKSAIGHERRRLAEETILVAKSAFVDPGSPGRKPPRQDISGTDHI